MTFSAARHDKAGGSLEDFEAVYGSEVTENTLQRICEAAYTECGSRKHDETDITIGSIHRHDAINMTFTGTVMMPDGIEYGFIIDDGNWNGTQVQEWGLAENVGLYEPPKPDPWRLFPKDAFTLRADRPGLWKVYLLWRKESWFSDLERAYNYDLHFAPGGKTTSYYTGGDSVATKRGLVWRVQSEVDAFIARPDSEFQGLPTTEELLAAWNAIDSA